MVDPRRRPDDRAARNEAIARMGKRALIAIVPVLFIGIIVTALGVPWWIVFGTLIVVLFIILFQT
ncbi:MAG TPA: hypothetical protein VGQ20_00275 [Acidimicrobiales bacterium]|jgi:membrane protein YdbS with pleckstrin-like domain|nr:hypothetical protein [Acidimicrobiales bacterium]